MKKFLGAAWLTLLLVVGGCAAVEQVPVVKTVTIEKQVPVKAKAPAELVACGKDKPDFRFYESQNGDAALKSDDQKKLMNWVDKKDNCISAWGEWNGNEY